MYSFVVMIIITRWKLYKCVKTFSSDLWICQRLPIGQKHYNEGDMFDNSMDGTKIHTILKINQCQMLNSTEKTHENEWCCQWTKTSVETSNYLQFIKCFSFIWGFLKRLHCYWWLTTWSLESVDVMLSLHAFHFSRDGVGRAH